MEATVYNQTGKETGKIKLPEAVFGLSWNSKNEKLVHQVVVSMMSNNRIPVAHTKNRGEVSGTGAKPWRQKGTGRARHGSRRSPIWVGGGVAHGPRNEKNFSRKINKKMKTKALFAVLSRKFDDGEIIFLSELSIKAPKTKEAKSIISSLANIKEYESLNKKRNAAFLALSEKNDNISKSFRNFSNFGIGLFKDLNVLDLLQYKYLIINDSERAVKLLEAKI